ncbi:MAG: bifunctional phosphoribosylaminoimidazolecarboxamide formyltransferase/IMP cyclohydrolase PurH [Methanobacteriota archaeon]|nr:MAG: bifunctional phosphoribosylaminoimidazolecarboxamide formyltransferase/IMP cyclohydrolase PurH [Euryarchaeota archaeon]HIL44183.1 bifunctional phosphoribosylaminoimidazolecarboxamide formyltransferase/IMP cyclohydrolase [Candidatus Poseidoniales archaeon]
MAQPRALLSVWEKSGIEDLGRALSAMGWELLSTGGTARALRSAGLEVTDVSEATGHPEVFDGRVKTLHPAVHGGILVRRDREDDMTTLAELGYGTIDLVCVNLYPFEATAARDPPASDAEIIEMIDIGGPTMVRSAAKNHSDVIVLTHPEQYSGVLNSLSELNGDPSGVDPSTRQTLALAAYQSTAAYDAAVSNELESRFAQCDVPSRIHVSSGSGTELRYGENPHQPAAFYPAVGEPSGLAAAVQHGGKPLSYNNYLDLDGALRLARTIVSTCSNFEHGCVVIKHTNPCGASVDETQIRAWESALASDPESAFGCVIAFTKPVEKVTAEAIGGHFFECMIAPGYEPGALEILSAKKNRRLLTLDPIKPRTDEVRMRQLDGGWLAQVQGPPAINWNDVKCVTEKQADTSEVALACFGAAVLAEVKSNAIILISRTATGCATVGVGPGQTSRVEAVKIAARRAGERANGSMMVSDAFFPFRDGIDAANDIGVSTVVQPGGSIRDQESIDAANEHGMAMLFTGTRLFLH